MLHRWRREFREGVDRAFPGLGRSDELVQDAVMGFFDELAFTRDMLERRYRDLATGRVQPIDGDEAYRLLLAKNKRTPPASCMSGFTLHPEAYAGIDQIRAYIAEDTPAAADTVVNEIFDRLRLLPQFPNRGFRRPNFTPLPLRFVTVREYLIAYAPEKNPSLPCSRFEGKSMLKGDRRIPSRGSAERRGWVGTKFVPCLVVESALWLPFVGSYRTFLNIPNLDSPAFFQAVMAG